MPRKKKKPEPEELPPEMIREVMSAMGRKGGKVRGIAKARTSEQARAAVMVRWEKARKLKAETPPADIDKPGTGECPPTP